jgi:hypothetical protein
MASLYCKVADSKSHDEAVKFQKKAEKYQAIVKKLQAKVAVA